MGPEFKIREAIRLHGSNSNSFLSLYKGFRYLEIEDGAIAYADTRKAWVGAAEPLVEKDRMESALRGFAERAGAAGKVAMAFPVSEDVARLARTLGYNAVKIGAEPIFDFAKYVPDVELVHTAKRLQARGAIVAEFRPDSLKDAERAELEQITEEWLESRKMVTLSFLNTVDPWALAPDKRYFKIALRGEVLAFVAAVPVWRRNGWYLIDLLRRHVTPAGSTELLILEAMRILKSGGAQDVSLGVAPLAELRPFADPDHPLTYRVLDLVFRRGNLFYNFQPLHEFKLKFNPTRSDAAYLIFSPSQVSRRVLSGLGEAFLPDGFIDATLSGIYRSYYRFRFSDWLSKRLNEKMVFRLTPDSAHRMAWRFKGTFGILAGLWVIHNIGPSRWTEVAAFTGQDLLQLKLYPSFLSGLFHWGQSHLLLNSLLLVVFGGLFEYLAGTPAMLGCFALGSVLSNPLTIVAFSPLKWLAPGVWSGLIVERDVGASLGIFSCAGALSTLLRRKAFLIGLLVGSTIGYCLAIGSFLEFNHLAGLALGLLAFSVYLEV